MVHHSPNLVVGDISVRRHNQEPPSAPYGLSANFAPSYVLIAKTQLRMLMLGILDTPNVISFLGSLSICYFRYIETKEPGFIDYASFALTLQVDNFTAFTVRTILFPLFSRIIMSNTFIHIALPLEVGTLHIFHDLFLPYVLRYYL